MAPSPELRTRLRKLLDERIPDGGRDTDTRLLDEDLDEILTESASVFAAAAMGWTVKAGMLQSEMGTPRVILRCRALSNATGWRCRF